jgi:hypothetical protein
MVYVLWVNDPAIMKHDSPLLAVEIDLMPTLSRGARGRPRPILIQESLNGSTAQNMFFHNHPNILPFDPCVEGLPWVHNENWPLLAETEATSPSNLHEAIQVVLVQLLMKSLAQLCAGRRHAASTHAHCNPPAVRAVYSIIRRDAHACTLPMPELPNNRSLLTNIDRFPGDCAQISLKMVCGQLSSLGNNKVNPNSSYHS